MFVARSTSGRPLADHPHPLLALLRAETSHLRALLITGLVLAAALLVSVAARPGRPTLAVPPSAAAHALVAQ
ncbi:MAG: hypothetical protein JNM56_40495 [Planctomycetia bacterium]|nr:hypothetical protein [Planctomycetia bacterium]